MLGTPEHFDLLGSSHTYMCYLQSRNQEETRYEDLIFLRSVREVDRAACSLASNADVLRGYCAFGAIRSPVVANLRR